MPKRRLSPRRAARTPTSREVKARKGKIAGIVVIICVITAFASFFAYKLFNPKPQIDAETNCPKTGPATYTAIVIDTTDSINAIQKIAIENEFSQIKAQVPKFGALAIYAAGFEGEVSKPVFAQCNPGDVSQMDKLREGRILVKKRWTKDFQQPLDRVLQKMLSRTPADNTPLLEAIQSVSVQSFGQLRGFGKDEVPKKLIIISDMLQNSVNLNLYKQIPPIQQFLKSEAYKKIRSDLRDVDVSIFFIRRQTKKGIQGPKLLRFWEDLILAQGGRLIHFKPIEG